ncbi:MAG: esterase family protein [Actinomycetota bacterium]|nr:esterase family protein [Actinomycetota bacterium]
MSNSVLMAERHPDLFGQVVSLSGINNIENPYAKAGLLSALVALNRYSAPDQVNRIWGDPVTSDATWRARNPTDQVCGLGHAWVWLSSGDGVPGAQDAGPGLPGGAQTETAVRMTNDDLSKAMTAVGLRFTYRQRQGIHSTHYWKDDVALVLPQLMRRLATGAPAGQPRLSGCPAS